MSTATALRTSTVELNLRHIAVPLRAALVAVSDDVERPILNAVHVYWRGGIEPLVVEATDSFRAHQVKTTYWPGREGYAPPFDVLVPGRWLRVTVAALAGDDMSTLRFAGGRVTATGYGESRTTSLVQGTYPNLAQFTATPEQGPERETAVTAAYLQGMFKAAALWPDDPICFTVPAGANQPIHVTIKPPDTLVTLILMPVRVP